MSARLSSFRALPGNLLATGRVSQGRPRLVSGQITPPFSGAGNASEYATGLKLTAIRGKKSARRAKLATVASAAGRSLLPGGQKQAKVKLPALLIEVEASDVLNSDDQTMATVEAAVRGGATGVVLYDGKAGGARLYDAACRLKEALRGRAVLLVVDRTDIADAAEADGVLLSPQGVPIAVARRLMSGARSLVGSLVADTSSAVAAAEQGANLIVLQGGSSSSPSAADLSNAVAQQKAGSIPVIGAVAGTKMEARAAAGVVTSSNEASGISVPAALLQACGDAAGPTEAAQALLSAMGGAAEPEPSGVDSSSSESSTATIREKSSEMGRLLSQAREDLVAEEKELLQDALLLLKEVSPGIAEIELLEDAITGLDELFLLVVVGEFNSGKSSFINALLGKRFLAEGILPTTNEISVLKWTDGEERMEQDADGMYYRYLPADLLKEVNIVDTPGTNVVLERQQRLTEEYIPRADLVLFVMSADRPFTDSEVRFLKYIRQWGKKIVFVLNKADLLENEEQVEQVRAFVSNNALQLLGVEGAEILPISARNALRAKVEAGSEATGGILRSMDDETLAWSAEWTNSGFAKLESFLLNFLLGTQEQGASESVRLKLQTPLAVADALLGASQQQLANDRSSAVKDLKALQMVESQLAAFRAEMERDSGIQREKMQQLVRAAAARASGLVDRELQLSSSNLSTYLFQGSSSKGEEQPVAQGFRSDAGGISSELLKIVGEHTIWVQRNMERQVENYRSFAESRAEVLGVNLQLNGGGANGTQGEQTKALVRVGGEAEAAVKELDLSSVALLLNEEVRESFVVTGAAVAGAVVLEVLMTTLLPTTLEDILATVVAGAVAYLAVLNLPLRRAETKQKVQRVAENFAREVDAAMERELGEALDETIVKVVQWVDPLIDGAKLEVAKIEDAERRRAEVADKLDAVRERTNVVV